MMTGLNVLRLCILVILPQLSRAYFCNAFSTGPVANGTFIRVANSTLVVPQPALPQVGDLSLWTGMGTSNGDLIQALIDSYSGDLYRGCGKLNGHNWCTWSSTLKHTKQGQLGSTQKKANVGDHVTQSYVYNDTTRRYDQYTYINGVRTSTLRTHSGKALGWGTAEECLPGTPCGYLGAHDWINTVLVFDVPDPTYNETFAYNGATADMITTDGGRTWTATNIHINACNFTASQ